VFFQRNVLLPSEEELLPHWARTLLGHRGVSPAQPPCVGAQSSSAGCCTGIIIIPFLKRSGSPSILSVLKTGFREKL